MATEESPVPSDDIIIQKTQEYVKIYMSQFDASHDYAHIQRVLSLAHILLTSEQRLHPQFIYDPTLVTLGALLHDVGDKKYLQPGQSATTMVSDFLLSIGATPHRAANVQRLVSHVSFSSEKKDPDTVRAVLAEVPELGIVQDADRLDAIGAVGVGRCFAFNGAKGGSGGLEAAVEHFREKLEELEGLMKTESGREMAKVRTERLRVFREWWEEEVGLGDTCL